MRLTRVFPLGAAAVALVVGASACGSSTGANTITMTPAEAAELFSEMSEAFGTTGYAMSQMPAGVFVPARVATIARSAAATITMDTTVSCAAGGTIAVSGSVNTGTSVSFNITEAPNSCQTAHFTVGGSVNISGNVNSSTTTITFTDNVKGSLDVTRNADGSSGTCAIDFTINGSVETSTFASIVTASGTICGVDASGVVTS